MPEVKIETVGFDARFPNVNQTRHCWQNYEDYYKCIAAKGEEYVPCKQFLKAYKSLCPPQWVEKWEETREKGLLSFPMPVATEGSE